MGHTDPGGTGKRARPNPHLRAQRARLDLTQQEVAEALAALAWEDDHRHLGVDAAMVSKWERGEKLPRPLYRRLLCALYNCTQEDLGLRQTQGG
ncbi:MAG: helix-turn-helix transcriptional regulator, partial [Actinobacteria bacterium]